VKVEATEIEGRKIYSVAAFNEGVAIWLRRLPRSVIGPRQFGRGARR